MSRNSCTLRIILLLALIQTALNAAYAQKQQNIWYFGEQAGLDFNQDPPASLTNGQTTGAGGMNPEVEGTAGICDSSGAILFYSNGAKVWNRLHKLMKNGEGIYGHPSSTQSSLILPQPGNNHFFYLFTTDAFVTPRRAGFRYSIIDMCAENGLGAVMPDAKNVLILDTVAEKLTAVRHQNGVDYWVIVHKVFTNAFYAYRFSASGLSDQVVSRVGSSFGGFHTGIGQMKASPDGSRLALVTGNGSSNFRELFSFNKTTGEVSGWIDLGSSTQSGANYGVSFSPDNSKLYLTGSTGPWLEQYDLGSGGGDPQAIKNSVVRIAQAGRALQLGPDGKIYVPAGNYLGIIQQPNAKGLACNFQAHGLWLNGKNCSLGLPNMVDAFDYSNKIPPKVPVSLGKDTTLCKGTPILLKDTHNHPVYLWSTGSAGPSLHVTQPGQYWVQANIGGCKNSVTTYQLGQRK